MPKWNGGLGLRKLENMNQACLLKIGWKYHGGKNDLWCRVLRGKYEDGREGCYVSKVTDSHLWKTMVALQPKLEEYSFWSV
jgi:hypothetical protein